MLPRYLLYKSAITWGCHLLSPMQTWTYLLPCFRPGEDSVAQCWVGFLLDIMQQEAPFCPLKMKLEAAMSCVNDLIVCNVADGQGRDTGSSCFRDGTLDFRRRRNIDVNQSPASFCTSIKLPHLPLSVWNYAPHGNPIKTFRNSEEPVWSAS